MKLIVRLGIVATWVFFGMFMALLVCGGCSRPTSDLSVTLGQATLTSHKSDTDIDIGELEYHSDPNGVSRIVLRSYKVAEARASMERDAALAKTIADAILAALAAGVTP